MAAAILRDNGIHDVRIEPVAGNLTDHDDPRSKTLRLSEGVYASRSMAAAGIAAHFLGGAATVLGQTAAVIGVGLFATTTVFTLITLPVEFDASKRALLTLLYFAFRLGLLGGRRD